MKILFSTDGLLTGGKEKQICLITKYFLEQDYEIKILTFNDLPSNNYLKTYNISLERITELKSTSFKTGFKAYKKAIADFTPDIIVNWDVRSGLWGVFLQNKLNVPVVNGSIRIGAHYKLKKRIIENIIVRFSKFNIANSKAGLKIYNLKENKRNKVIYNAIEVDRKYNEKTETLHLFEKVFGQKYKDNFIVSISIGNLRPKKDNETVIRAIAKLKNPNLFHVLLGDGSEKMRLEQLTKDLKLENKVKLLGAIEDVEQYLNFSDVFIHPSYSEGCSNAILECMKYQLPIITTKTGGTSEIVYQKVTRFFEYKNTNELVKQLTNINDLIKKTQDDIVEYKNHITKFDLNTIGRETELFYKEVVGKNN